MNLVEQLHQRADMLSPGISACVGCNVELTLRTVLRILGPRTILAIPPGCMGGVGVVGWGRTTGCRVPVFFPLLTNTASMLTGIRLAYRRLYPGKPVQVVAFAGDGASADAGFQALSGAAERGEDILYICYDNEGYMNTGFQRSGTTARFSATSTTPPGRASKGKAAERKEMALIMAAHGVSYVATASPAFPADLVHKVERASEATGFRYLHILNPCVTGWGFEPEESIEIARLTVQTGWFPLYEVAGGRLTLQAPVGGLRDVRELLGRLRKFRHLTDAEVEELRESVVRRYELIRALSRLGATPA